jgi:hypothetical protein
VLLGFRTLTRNSDHGKGSPLPRRRNSQRSSAVTATKHTTRMSGRKCTQFLRQKRRANAPGATIRLLKLARNRQCSSSDDKFVGVILRQATNL